MRRGLIMPGYGAQYVGMGKELYDTERAVQECFEEASDCVQTNFVKLFFASSDAELGLPQNASLALFVMGASSVELLKEAHVQVDEVVGFDVAGFMSALYAAGSINFPDGLYVLKKWSELYVQSFQDQSDAGLVVYATDPQARGGLLAFIQHCIERNMRVAVAKIVPDACYVRGEESVIAQVREACADTQLVGRVRVQPWSTLSNGVYSPVYDLAAAQLWQYLEKIDILDPQIRVLDPFEGVVLASAENVRVVLREILLRTFRVDRLVAACALWETVFVGLPSARVIDTLHTWLRERRLVGFETVESYRELIREFGTKQE